MTMLTLVQITYQGMLDAYFCTRIAMMVWVKLMLAHFFRILLPNLPLGHLFADTRVQLTHLRALLHTVA